MLATLGLLPSSPGPLAPPGCGWGGGAGVRSPLGPLPVLGAARAEASGLGLVVLLLPVPSSIQRGNSLLPIPYPGRPASPGPEHQAL